MGPSPGFLKRAGGGGGGAPDFSAVPAAVAANPIGDLDSNINYLNTDSGGNTVADTIINLNNLYRSMYGAQGAVDGINNTFSDADLTAVSSVLGAEAENVYSVITNLEGDTAGDSVAQAIADLTAIRSTLQAL